VLAVFGVVKRRNVGGACPGLMEFDEIPWYTGDLPVARPLSSWAEPAGAPAPGGGAKDDTRGVADGWRVYQDKSSKVMSRQRTVSRPGAGRIPTLRNVPGA